MFKNLGIGGRPELTADSCFKNFSAVFSKLAYLHALQFAFSRCSLVTVKEFRMTTPKPTNTIAACFQAAKRVRLDADLDAAHISNFDTTAEPGDNEAPGLVSISKKAKTETTTQDSPDGSNAGVETDRTEDGTSISGSKGEDVVSPGEGTESNLTKEQRMRMELNKGIARAKRNLKACEDHVEKCRGEGKSFPELRDLLVDQTWLDVLKESFSSSKFTSLYTFLQQEVNGPKPIYPPPALIFNAFNTCPFEKVKVVIIGQDPYHGPRQAMGLCFSIPHGVKVPSSLVNIFKEIRDDVGCTLPSHGNLEKWAHQGVLLLNAVLTVREHNANSHAKKGWESFTDAAIVAISQKREGVVFLLWGNSAQDKERLINTKKHHVLKAAHPSGLSAHRGFFKCRHFSKTNELLEKAGELPIDWQL
ncbi:uracil-DNA glycosylase [Marchantia polymorpha subsp. ruderalis]|uniref:Uracil-DNA glycosylase n=2 Tax=Marchantia polymorpha TaxID=3197 RepID=A0A2R6X9L3_MARPO|nr:hypothetical protein MARPO_0028s0106 [Marchantia polymorpha]BBN00598.1 hypothetical protein Mp_2g00450 [Marchantia polymorpha subsp. ruderalis]|eukprot:PTQ42798.1 hypothetical protein MARPO_0028s0106 [Marchantia polymorpha]